MLQWIIILGLILVLTFLVYLTVEVASLRSRYSYLEGEVLDLSSDNNKYKAKTEVLRDEVRGFGDRLASHINVREVFRDSPKLPPRVSPEEVRGLRKRVEKLEVIVDNEDLYRMNVEIKSRVGRHQEDLRQLGELINEKVQDKQERLEDEINRIELEEDEVKLDMLNGRIVRQ